MDDSLFFQCRCGKRFAEFRSLVEHALGTHRAPPAPQVSFAVPNIPRPERARKAQPIPPPVKRNPEWAQIAAKLAEGYRIYAYGNGMTILVRGRDLREISPVLVKEMAGAGVIQREGPSVSGRDRFVLAKTPVHPG